jgi:cell division cycle 14
MMIVMKMKAKDAYQLMSDYHGALIPFRDASKGDCYYECTVLHCLEGLEAALRLGWYNYDTFNSREYRHYEKVENGDLNWIVPGKFIAFMGPVDREYRQKSQYGHSAESYTTIFRHLNVTRVIRLNDHKYKKESFENKCIAHDDMIFRDGSTPPPEIVAQFLTTCENHFAN